MTDRKSGTIKFFRADKGFGFIKSPEQDVYLHISDVVDGTTPERDSVYYYDKEKGRDGKPQAKNASQDPVIWSQKQSSVAEKSNDGERSKHDLHNWAFIPMDTVPCKLAELALHEDWDYSERTEQRIDKYGVLKNYITYTFMRLSREKKILEIEKFAVFNTGLVDSLYRPIYALFETNHIADRQPWKWCSFCVSGEGPDGKLLARTFSRLPPVAKYFDTIDTIYFDADAPFDENVGHIIHDGIREDRYPPDFITKYAGGFSQEEYSRNKEQYLAQVAERLEFGSSQMIDFNNRLEHAVRLARKRAGWNYRAVVPQYYPRHDKMSLLLPLALVDDTAIDAALVVEPIRVDGELKYQAHTILSLPMAYKNARLVAKPISDWLTSEKIIGN
jgi:cold shock CspA family protein